MTFAGMSFPVELQDPTQKIGLEEQVRKDIRKMVAQDTSPGMFMKDVLGEHLN